MHKTVVRALGLVVLLWLPLGAAWAGQNWDRVEEVSPSETLLAYAKSGEKDPEVYADLLEHGADVNYWDEESKRTPLHYLISYRNSEAVKLLLAHGADINARDKSGRTPLHDAVSYMLPEVVRELVEKGAELNLKDVESRSTLHNLIYWDGQAEAVGLARLFAEKGFDFKNFTDADFLNQAISRGRGDLATVLMENGTPFDEQSLVHAARTGREDLYFPLLEKGLDPRQKDIMRGACEAGNVNIIKDLTVRGVKPTAEDVDFCLYRGHRDAAVFLSDLLKKTEHLDIDIQARCRLEPQDGACKALFWAGYYDATAKECREFAYGGCGGVTPFEDLEACKRVCEE